MSDPGYRLPDGDCYTEDVCPVVVCVPNKPEYFRALRGSLSYLATWVAWERDALKRGKDAAASWRYANDLTGLGDEMGCLDDTNALLEQILALLAFQNQCCGPNITYGDQTVITTLIVPGVGDDPTVYGETEVADWEEWLEYLCAAGNAWLDELISQMDTIYTLLNVGSVALAVIAAVIEAVLFLETGGAVSILTAQVVVAALSAGALADSFLDAKDDLESARPDINCALQQSASLSDAIEGAVAADVWGWFLQYLDYDSITALLYEGGHDGEYLALEPDGSCSCPCAHAALPLSGATGDLIYQNALGCQFEVGVVPSDPLAGHQYGEIGFNITPGVGYCGPMKVLDSISVDDAYQFTRILLQDQAGDTVADYYSGGTACNKSLSLAVGQTCARVILQRAPVASGGCAQSLSIVTIEYHDA